MSIVESTSDGRAQLNAIIANSDDDTPRLVFADWLDEYNQPERAEFIRTQIELARGGADDSLAARQRDLLARHGQDWVGPLGKGGAAVREGSVEGGWWWKGAGFRFCRGLVEEVKMSPAEFGRLPRRLFAAHPIRAVHFPTGLQHRSRRGWLRPALARPEFRRLTEVDLSNSWVDAGNLTELAGCGNLGRVRCLDLT